MLAPCVRTSLFFGIPWLFSTAPMFAQQTITFDHLQDGDRTYTLHLQDGEEFTVQIQNTCSTMFQYEVRGFEPESPISALAPEPLSTKELSLTHEDVYGGYVVLIRRASDSACEGGDALQDRVLVIYVPTTTWSLAFAGGFTVEGLTDAVYALQPHSSIADAKQIVTEAEKRDKFTLGVATFAHVYHTGLPWLTGTFGLGIQEPTKTEYYLGPGVRLGDTMTISLGVVLGTESRLPAGIDKTRPVFDDNILSDLPRKASYGWFLALSYSFLQTGDQFKKPFAGSSTGG